jgi:hypothetical protein
MSLPSSLASLSSGNPNDATWQSTFRNTLKFLLFAPFRVLTRLLSLDGLLDREEEPNQTMSPPLIYSTEGSSPMAHMASPPPSTFHHTLGPWSFFASGYAIYLFAMVRRVRRKSLCLSPYLDLSTGSTLEPHPEHCRSKSAATTTCSRLPLPSGFSSRISSLNFPDRFLIYLLQSGPSVANYVFHPRITSPLVNLALASRRLFSSFLMEAI